jgi:outer membrane murein-binding lipoprotein Lpp
VKRLFPVTAAIVAFLAVAGPAPASAAISGDKRIAVLEHQVKTLQAQVKALKKETTGVRQTVDSNQQEFRKEASRNRVGDACMALAVADAFQSTWTNVDRRAASGPAFGPQQKLDDVSCTAIGVARPGIQIDPTVGAFWALTGWLIG